MQLALHECCSRIGRSVTERREGATRSFFSGRHRRGDRRPLTLFSLLLALPLVSIILRSILSLRARGFPAILQQQRRGIARRLFLRHTASSHLQLLRDDLVDAMRLIRLSSVLKCGLTAAED